MKDLGEEKNQGDQRIRVSLGLVCYMKIDIKFTKFPKDLWGNISEIDQNNFSSLS